MCDADRDDGEIQISLNKTLITINDAGGDTITEIYNTRGEKYIITHTSGVAGKESLRMVDTIRIGLILYLKAGGGHSYARTLLRHCGNSCCTTLTHVK